jgi:hypothetical protein
MSITAMKQALDRVVKAIDEPNNTMSNAKALKEIMRQLRLIHATLRTAIAKAEKQDPVAKIFPCYTPSGKRVALNTEYQHLPIGTDLYTTPQPQQEPVARLHVTETDTYPDIEVEVLNGATLQPSMSPINIYTTPPPLTGGDDRRHIICLCPDCVAPQPQQAEKQEPVAVARVDDLERGGRVRALAMGLALDAPLYTTPQPQRECEGCDKMAKP